MLITVAGEDNGEAIAHAGLGFGNLEMQGCCESFRKSQL
jgi:hypothetical protein